MKSLKDFINEQLNESNANSISFNFSDIENADSLLKTLEDTEFVTINDKTVTISVNSNNVNKIGAVKDIIEQAIKAERNSSRSTNDEQYAQKIKGLESKLKELENVIATFQADDSKEETPDPEETAEKDAKDDEKE
jgi:hypothetical protein